MEFLLLSLREKHAWAIKKRHASLKIIILIPVYCCTSSAIWELFWGSNFELLDQYSYAQSGKLYSFTLEALDKHMRSSIQPRNARFQSSSLCSIIPWSQLEYAIFCHMTNLISGRKHELCIHCENLCCCCHQKEVIVISVKSHSRVLHNAGEEPVCRVLHQSPDTM